MPFSIFRLQTLTAANIVGFVLGTALFSMFLILTLYMQQVLGLSPLETGVGYLAVAGTAIIWANVAAAAVTRVGVKPALVFGMALMTVGLLYFTQVSVGGSYWTDLFPGFLIIGLGMPFAFVPITIAAVAGTKPEEAGLASGLINTSQQIGGAVGIAILSTIAFSTTTDDVAAGVAAAGRRSPTGSRPRSGPGRRSRSPASSSRSSSSAGVTSSTRRFPRASSRLSSRPPELHDATGTCRRAGSGRVRSG